MILRAVQALEGSTVTLAAPWVVMAALVLWVAALVVRLSRNEVLLRREIAALAKLSSLLESVESAANHTSARLRRSHGAPEQVLALRGMATLAPRLARTASEWLLLAHGSESDRNSPELVRLGLGFALEREVQSLTQAMQAPIRHLVPLALATTACGMVGAVLFLTSAATSRAAADGAGLATMAPAFVRAIASAATGFFLGCLAFSVNRLASGRLRRAHTRLAEQIAEIEHLAHRS